MRLPGWILALATVVLLLVGTSLVAGETWIVRTDLWGNPAFSTLTVDIGRGHVSGDLDGRAVQGSLIDGDLAMTSTDAQGRASHYTGRVNGNRMVGTADLPDTHDPAARARHDFTAWRVPERAGGPRRYDYVPTDYSNTWNADRPPVLTIWPGDTVHTSTVDSGGVDERGATRALFGNPQTGSFFIAGAGPGDTLVVHLTRVRLNRPYADSLDGLVGRALGSNAFPGASGLGNPVRWSLDLAAGRARPAHADGEMANYSIPVKPMLGGLGVAPGFGMPPISTGDTGRFGGNMDFNEVIEGNTVYLPVQQPGALLYLGDGHAVQGDGELTQYALETSMDVTFAVDLIKGRSIGMPRVESPTELMVLGQAGSLDEAVKAATTGMAQWLQQDYGLTLSQVTQVFGTAMHFTIPNLAGRSVGVAARIDKERLPPSKHLLTAQTKKD